MFGGMRKCSWKYKLTMFVQPTIIFVLAGFV